MEELNRILYNNIVPDRHGRHLHSFHKYQWEHDACEGTVDASSRTATVKEKRYHKVTFLDHNDIIHTS